MWEAVQMFRENKEHLNKSMFCTIDSMDPRYAKEIEEGWAGLFYKHVFCSIDEKLFEPLYSKDMGRSSLLPIIDIQIPFFCSNSNLLWTKQSFV